MILSKQEKAVFTPIALYGAMNNAITKKQLFKLIYKAKIDFSQMQKILKSLQVKNLITYNDDFVSLKNITKKDGTKFAKQIFAQNQKKLKNLARFPFVRAVVLTNSLAFGTAHKNSDIDLLIICKAGQIAIVRDLIKLWLLPTPTVIASRAKQSIRSPYPRQAQVRDDKKSGKIACDIWLDEQNLNIGDFKLKGDDIYFENWLATATPIYNQNSTFKNFIANNPLFKNFPNYQINNNRIFTLTKRQEKLKKNLEKVLSTLSPIAKFSQLAMLARLNKYKKRIENKGAILVSPTRLRFNIPDKRPEIQKKFTQIWQAIQK